MVRQMTKDELRKKARSLVGMSGLTWKQVSELTGEGHWNNLSGAIAGKRPVDEWKLKRIILKLEEYCDSNR